MDKFVKDLIDHAKAEGAEVHVIKVGNDEHKCKCTNEPDAFEEAKKEAAKIAKVNKILYEAHVCEGFTSEEAIAMTVAVITHK